MDRDELSLPNFDSMLVDLYTTLICQVFGNISLLPLVRANNVVKTQVIPGKFILRRLSFEFMPVMLHHFTWIERVLSLADINLSAFHLRCVKCSHNLAHYRLYWIGYI